MRDRAVGIVSLICLLGLWAALPLSAQSPQDRWIALFSDGSEPLLREASVPVWDREGEVVVAGPSEAQLDVLRAQGIEPLFSARDHGEGIYVLSHDRSFAPPVLAGAPRFRIDDGSMLYLIPAGLEMSLPQHKPLAMFHGVPRVAVPPVRVHPADETRPKASSPPNPLVQQIVDATSQESWFQYVRDLSGDSDVTIPGYCDGCRIRTRASDYMFPPNNTGNPPGNPFATEYLEDKGAGWGFTGPNVVRESYTSAESGCTARQGSQTWQNLIFTLPAQVDYAQTQQVLFIVHYDSISESPATDANDAPGADDAMSGGAALLEAMRLFKGYAWRYPVKFLFVSGEEVGLCGSTAYTRMHPAAPVWRVLNMDLTGYDGNKDGLMNLYNWSITKCPSCVAFGDDFIQANSDYGEIIDPAKILRNTSMMCGSDQCPFWKVGVTAIDLNEDLTDFDFCPCFDKSQTPNCRDTVTQTYPPGSATLMFDQDYAWRTDKAAIALLAHTAEPLYACPAKGAKLRATVGKKQVQLRWPVVPRVTDYVVERAEGGCGGTFTGIASTNRGSFTDTAVTPGAIYGYRVRTCPFQVSNCMKMRVPPR
ncbi:MAG TPA: M20/M25/M40 family metallo-hydrolase [Thermoanaerobaculia bacterium]